MEVNYVKVEYSRSRIEKAGKTIAKYSDKTLEYNHCIPVVDNWRAAHALPLDSITAIINTTLVNRQEINVVSRLKRLDSIIGKLQRTNNTGLYKMQDLGGCRIIVPNINVIKEIINIIKEALIENGHEIYKEYHYLENPREISGYRSHHIVVKYHDSEQLYDGMYIEVQIRTRLQHLWATAVEIMDATTNETLKVGTGKIEYMQFFKLVSGLFSIEEKTPIVDGISQNKQEIVEQIYKIDKKEGIREKLSAYNTAIRFTGDYKNEADYFLIEVDTRKATLSARPFVNSEINLAIEAYLMAESIRHTNCIDVLLVKAKNFDIIRENYPNYFRDASSFLIKVNEYCAEFPEKSAISFETASTSVSIEDYFEIKEYKGNKRLNIDNMNGIGDENGDVIICPDWPITHDESYLRYSGMVVESVEKFVFSKEAITTNKVNGPGIIVLSTGASFIILRDSWEFLSHTDLILIQCKENTNIDWLLFLIAWIKSNICTIDILCNIHAHSYYNKDKRREFLMPNPSKKMMSAVCIIVKSILKYEEEFVSGFYHNEEAKHIENIVNFNARIDSLLCELERIFINFFKLSTEDIIALKQELRVKGYYVYGTLSSND